ncbi:MAG: nucleotidyltransferase family protein [Bacteroidaceae bacterium]|nr:nucleotidyltransferase family protein [Bacteroidaceae bacterium]
MQTDNSNKNTEKEPSVIELFFSLIRCGIGKQQRLPYTPDAQQWNELFEIAQKQTLTGIAFAGIERLPKEQRPAKELLLQWYSLSIAIKNKNGELNNKCAIVSKKFKSEGFNNCILKGQGIAQLYPDPTLRTPGDIDIWLDGGDTKAINYVKRFFPDCTPTYHHVDFPIAANLEIEIHYRPSWSYNPFANKRLQRFFKENAATQFRNDTTTAQGTFTAPTATFNRVYILMHIYRHLFQEGIGLRQLLDYYFVLQQETTTLEKKEYRKLLKRFGLKNFAAATTYVLQKTFGLESEKQIVAPDKRRGEFLLKEVMLAGNFGKYDNRYNIVSQENEFEHFLNSMRRITRLIFQYPGETLWSPYFKIWHYLWRKRHQ